MHASAAWQQFAPPMLRTLTRLSRNCTAFSTLASPSAHSLHAAPAGAGLEYGCQPRFQHQQREGRGKVVKERSAHRCRYVRHPYAARQPAHSSHLNMASNTSLKKMIKGSRATCQERACDKGGGACFPQHASLSLAASHPAPVERDAKGQRDRTHHVLCRPAPCLREACASGRGLAAAACTSARSHSKGALHPQALGRGGAA